MGLKKFFKLKPPEDDTPEQNRINLQDIGVSVKNPNKKKHNKFAAYGKFAEDKKKNSKIYAPPGYEQYANPQQEDDVDDFNQGPGDMTPDIIDSGRPQNLDPYASNSTPSNNRNNDPYAININQGGNSGPYGGKGYGNSTDPYSTNRNANAYSSDPYAINRGSDSNESRYDSADPYSARTSNFNSAYPSSSNNNYSSSDPNDLNSSPYDYKSASESKSPYSISKFDNGNSQSQDPYSSNSRFSDSNNGLYATRQDRNNSDLNSTGRPNDYSTQQSRNPRNPQMKSANPYSSINPSATTTYGASTYNDRSPTNRQSPQFGSLPGVIPAAIPSAIPTASMPVNTHSPKQASSGRINIAKDANPYSAMSSDQYSTLQTTATGNANPYSRRSKTSQGDGLPKLDTTLTTDLNRTITDNDDTQDLNKAEFDFEDNYNSNKNVTNLQTTENSLPIDELNVNDTAGAVYGGDDLNATVQEQELEQLPRNDNQNAWQMDEQQQAYDYDYNDQEYNNFGGAAAGRSYKTFEEIQMEEEHKQRAEEEEVIDELKQEIKFTKQASVASTRNTLKMAHEAEMAGMNTLGMLGHQSERLNNIENNLNLMKVQNKTADDRVSELKNINRSIFAIHAKNPFTSKRRQMEKEERLRARKIEENLINERTNQTMYNSSQRIESTFNGLYEAPVSETRERYARDAILERSKKYQFENDEEDDAMEVEIDKNLDRVQQVSGRLKKLAVAVGDELDSQKDRINNIEDNAEDLDIKIHMNTIRLANVR
ncbi:hypothetical protein TPHA_0K01780 [Tetrapisispora phaffii CBS 4417]|uniref:t-SNARE coiled-coil homology domain-containing protein n=1 Tax=Tetrapisispora phaffii (strain ATCC 24235 / CBS 4417 / NBRC 1672 / NRRL Y-8282 / UCD 70-5) TaxID=1071381 RepID=G8BZI3_TETPH|nr:hypothetical protein TPHA_0K01780 [Tetrapisispora phaffii CBS 4417]CCE65311.1 hypothetical protein TPHA_0K01780 [Tetrapisispora phaffii CBS 4417]